MQESAGASMDGVFMVVVGIVYVAVYFATKLLARLALRAGPDATAPRLLALAMVIAVCVGLSFWMALQVPARVPNYEQLSPFDQGQVVGGLIAIFVLPAMLAVPVILVRLWLAIGRRRRQAARPRVSPQF